MPPLCPPAPLRGLLVLVLCTCFAVGTPPCPFSIGSFLLGLHRWSKSCSAFHTFSLLAPYSSYGLLNPRPRYHRRVRPIIYMAMDQYLLIPFLGGWTSIYQLFWCSPGVQGFDTLPYTYIYIIPIWATQMNKSNTNPGFRLGGFQYQRKGCFSIRRMRTLSRSSHWTYAVRGWLQLASERV